tara:strand:- start:4852 stop:6414 length:1563 start_codon:yes stop_codon:yes gene_type:complete
MDKIIKINSVQGFADSWSAAGPLPTVLDLVDFTIPRGLTVDLSRSYIAFNVEVATNQPEQVHNVDLYVDVGGNVPYNTPSSVLIRNANISCDRGQIESIRRHDSLATALFSISNDAETQKSDLNLLGSFIDERGVGNTTSYLVDAVVQNTNPDGSTDGRRSRAIPRDIKIPIKDVFGIGNADDWSTDEFGETRIHIETNFRNLKTRNLGGNEEASASFEAGINWGSLENVNMEAASHISQVQLKVDYLNLDVDLTCPFFVGQSVELSGNTAATSGGATTPLAQNIGAGSPLYGEISQIERVAGTAANAGKEMLLVSFVNKVYTAGGAPEFLTDLFIKAQYTQINTTIVNRAELVLYTVDETNPSKSFNYMTYLTEEDNGNGLTNLHRQYIVEPECQNLLIANIKNGQILPNNDYVSYRMSVDNEDLTGNRSVNWGTPLHFDRLNRCLNINSNIEWNNAQFRFYSSSGTQAGAYNGNRINLICETMPLTPGNKKVGLELDSTGNGDAAQQIILYKQVQRSI